MFASASGAAALYQEPILSEAPAGRTDVEVSAALESNPRVRDRVEVFWGYPEFRDYIENLVVVERERTARAGFPPEVLQELMFLHELDRDQRAIINRDTSSEGRLSLERDQGADIWLLSR